MYGAVEVGRRQVYTVKFPRRGCGPRALQLNLCEVNPFHPVVVGHGLVRRVFARERRAAADRPCPYLHDGLEHAF